MKKLNNKKGFTIVELVIVIAVIGILAGVLIPTFSSVTKSANESAALQEAKSTLENILAVNNGSIDANTKFYICNVTTGTTTTAEIKYTYSYVNNALSLDEENATTTVANANVIYLGTKNVTVDGLKVTALSDTAKALIKTALGATADATLESDGQSIKIGEDVIKLRFSPDIGEKMIVVIPKVSG